MRPASKGAKVLAQLQAAGAHKHADRMSAIGGKADIETWVSKSAFDPKRSSACIPCRTSEGGLSPIKVPV